MLAHDREADGLFIYAVHSTGCIAGPRARVAARDGSGFVIRYSPDARQAGSARVDGQARRHERGRPWYREDPARCVYLGNVEGSSSLATLAARLGGSPYHLQRNFKRLVGVTPREYAEACRLRKVKRGLREGGAVTGAMFDAGYGSSRRFYERAVPKLGMSPSTYRGGGAGMNIQYTIVDSSLGRLLVASTTRGVCAVSMGSSDVELERALAREYPLATIEGKDGALAKWTKAILGHLAGREPRLDLPLEVRLRTSRGRGGRS